MLKSNKFVLDDISNDTMDIRCPRCNADNLHHSTVTVFDRGEDAEMVTKTTVTGATASMEMAPSKEAGNPSGRRDGISIRFWCEGCGGDAPDDIIELTIAQHKGSTEIGWRYTPRKPKP